MAMNNTLELVFVEYSLDRFSDIFYRNIGGKNKKVLLRPFNGFAAEFMKKVSVSPPECTFYVPPKNYRIELPENINVLSDEESADVILLFSKEPGELSSFLMDYLDLPKGIIIAPITAAHCSQRPLFLISIPKSGTHLLYRVVETLGYTRGVVCPDNPVPGTWYCIEYSNSHTSARDFFVDTVRRSPFGNRHHPFQRSPAIFIYRNPLDILVSEANYYHKDGNTAFYSYLNNKSFEERLLTLIDDPWLLGSIRDRIGKFIPWVDLQNVIPVSFEELVGPKGGGSADLQTRLIWSLQLKLQVPGNPHRFGEKLFLKDSPTFHEGQIGSYEKYFTEKAYEKFHELPQDFMKLLGYDFNPRSNSMKIPSRVEEFRNRRLVCSEYAFDKLPIHVEYNFLGYNIVKYKDLYYGIPVDINELRIEHQNDDFLKNFLHDRDLTRMKHKIGLKRTVPAFAWELLKRFFRGWAS